MTVCFRVYFVQPAINATNRLHATVGNEHSQKQLNEVEW